MFAKRDAGRANSFSDFEARWGGKASDEKKRKKKDKKNRR
jgi:hypothetical protein